jgi:ABC-2 type transport system permease protein
VNLHHLATFVWLRWRLAVNRTRRAGLVSFILSMILLGCAILGGIGAFGVAYLLGVVFLPEATAFRILMTWDGLVFGFLVFWSTGLIAELQRSELFGIEKFLHLPVTLGGVFLMNYLASFVSIALILFVPAVTGFILALIQTYGFLQSIAFVPTAALIFVVTALTYQFRGWLAAMMTDPRRRRFVISVVTMVFVLLVQIPNLANLAMNSSFEPGGADRRHEAEHAAVAWADKSAALANAVVPMGWLPYAATALTTEGRIWPSLIATVALSLIAGASLRRSYLTTIRMHTGEFTANKAPPRPAVRTNRPLLVERSIPGLSEHASAIAMTSLRSFLRAPEAKIMLMTPVIMVVIFGVMFLTRSFRPAPEYRPLVAFGALASGLLSMGNLVINPFGFDRSGFRALVLSSADRRDILIGKNLAIAPFVIGLQAILVTLIQIVLPLRFDQLLALIPQALTMFVLFCLVSNLAAILAPGAIAAGTMKPTAGSGTMQMIRLGIVFATPFVLSIALLPYGFEMALDKLLHMTGPYTLGLSLILAALAGLFYWVAIGWEAWLLERRELDILGVVAAKAE